ncbi:MAG: hypothetical protein LQ351_002709 [Letrouitia transgressa]|nr:MAG: hypothetical protein LQ351_002709 [Letrouitia transgressa]
MKLFVSSLQSVLGACLLFQASIAQAAYPPGCNADNCLRALFPSASPSALSAASAFCATYTTIINTATTGFPARATGGCGSSPSRYSSACSCKPTATTTLTTTTTTPTCTPTPANNLIKNGGFECGLAPWVAGDVTNTRHYVRGPGDASPNAFEFNQVGPVDPASNQNPAFLTQDFTATAGTAYRLNFRTYFDKCTTREGFVGVRLNQAFGTTVDACDFGGSAGSFKSNSITFTPTTNAVNVRFEFLTNEPDAVFKLDNIAFVPA